MHKIYAVLGRNDRHLVKPFDAHGVTPCDFAIRKEKNKIKKGLFMLVPLRARPGPGKHTSKLKRNKDNGIARWPKYNAPLTSHYNKKYRRIIDYLKTRFLCFTGA